MTEKTEQQKAESAFIKWISGIFLVKLIVMYGLSRIAKANRG